PHGRLVGVEMDEALAPALLATLHPDERALAAAFAPGRQLAFAAGRAALRIALADLGLPAGPVLVGERGGPRLPAGALGSVSHKRQLAVALAAVPDPDGRI